MSRVSVIIPVYNVAAHVEACLRSVLSQSHTDLEVLVCDDGSTDESGAICDRIAAVDGRVHVIHALNRGVSAARNACLDQATGDYIAPVDSDDLIDPTYIERLLHACEEHDTDIALCDYRKIDESGRQIDEATSTSVSAPTSTSECRCYSNTEWLEMMYHPTASGMSVVPWGKLYRRHLFEDGHVRYPEGEIHEDQSTTFRLFYASRGIAYLQTVLYSYRIRSGSIMRRAFRKERVVIVDATRGQCDFFLQRHEQRLATLAVNNHLRTEFSVLANLREMRTAEGDVLAGQLVQTIRADSARYLPLADLPVSKRLFYRMAALMPLPVFIQQLRMF